MNERGAAGGGLVALFLLALCLIAVGLRVPSLGESLWVDELHSAWAVHDGWASVGPRAEIGNQEPAYFWVLWGWSRVVGESAAALRGLSVIAVAVACVLLVLAARAAQGAGTTDWGAGGLAGGLAGVLFAVDRHSMFFGTEARGYALVMLAVAVMLWSGVHAELGMRRRRIWYVVFGAAACGAIWIHITATTAVLGVIGALVLWGGRPNAGVGEQSIWSSGLALSGCLGVVLGLGLSADTLARAWQHRGQWSSFGRADGWDDFWRMWPWVWLVFLPVLLWCVSVLWRRGGVARSRKTRAEVRTSAARLALGLLAAVVLVTWGTWWVAWLDWVALWHRRFLVGLLPPLCLGAGLLWEECWEQCCGGLSGRWVRGISGVVVGCAVALGLMVSEGTVFFGGRGLAPEMRLVNRGEPWREAVNYVREHRQTDERVAVAAQLLESQWLVSEGKSGGDANELRELSAEQLEYLTYAVRGPYELEDVTPWGPLDDWGVGAVRKWVRGEDLFGGYGGRARPLAIGEQAWLLVRGRKTRVGEWLEGLEREFGAELIPFGKLTVVRIWEEAR